jgi:hypothetical protein
MRSRLLPLLALFLLQCKTAPTAPPAQVPANTAQPEAESGPTIEGDWKEYWGVAGQTDVTYHDEYRVDVDPDGAVSVSLVGAHEEQEIVDEAYVDGALTFTLTTSFQVRYRLELEPGGGWLAGSATTPKETVPIRWERLTP